MSTKFAYSIVLYSTNGKTFRIYKNSPKKPRS